MLRPLPIATRFPAVSTAITEVEYPLAVTAVAQAIAGCTREPLLGIMGPRRVHVLCVNVALDHAVPQR